MIDAEQPGSSTVKQCCASFYGSEVARALLGESFHPGGLGLTLELAEMLRIDATSRVLDVASGKGSSAFAVAERFGCRVAGVDLSEANVVEANGEAAKRGLADRVSFQLADAERLPFETASFDALLCECAFCTFPDKAAAAFEFARVVRPGGRVGISDLTRAAGPLPELDGLVARVACVADAQPPATYAAWLAGAGFAVTDTVARDSSLQEMVDAVRGKLFMTEIMIGLKKLELPGFDIEEAKRFVDVAARAVRDGTLGYALIVGERGTA